MICERCGEPYRVYSPWYEPPENHYYHCSRCNRTYYPYDASEEEDDYLVGAALVLVFWFVATVLGA